ncbi:hypothetical protein O0882_15880 [Janthinobacterium sp. SUN073]|nr:hypothetical protein [Janthinobacterium sp. SUN073]
MSISIANAVPAPLTGPENASRTVKIRGNGHATALHALSRTGTAMSQCMTMMFQICFNHSI